MTYSIVARDPTTGELGLAVQSRAFGAAAICAFAQPGVGVVSTQAHPERAYGPRLLKRIAGGENPAEALDDLAALDKRAAFRQIGVVAANGEAAAHTGDACVPDCGHEIQDDMACQGNMLASRDVWPAMASTFRRATGSLPERLLAALDAGERAGGDFRGRQSAGMVIVSGDANAAPWERTYDLRVDDHPEPLQELRRLYVLARAQRRRGELAAGAEPEPDELEAAQAAGLRSDQIELLAALIDLRNNDASNASRRLTVIAASDPRWLVVFRNYERLGYIPRGFVPSS